MKARSAAARSAEPRLSSRCPSIPIFSNSTHGVQGGQWRCHRTTEDVVTRNGGPTKIALASYDEMAFCQTSHAATHDNDQLSHGPEARAGLKTTQSASNAIWCAVS